MNKNQKTTVEKTIILIGFVICILLSILVTIEIKDKQYETNNSQTNKRLDKIIEFMRCEK